MRIEGGLLKHPRAASYRATLVRHRFGINGLDLAFCLLADQATGVKNFVKKMTPIWPCVGAEEWNVGSCSFCPLHVSPVTSAHVGKEEPLHWGESSVGGEGGALLLVLWRQDRMGALG